MWLLNFLMSACFVFAVLLAFEQIFLPQMKPYSYLLISWPALLCFPVGLIASRNGLLKIILLPVSCLLACLYMLGTLSWEASFDIFYLAAFVAMSAYMYLIGIRDSEDFPPTLTSITIVLYLVELFALSKTKPEVMPILSVVSIVAYILGLIVFNAASLQAGVHNAKGGAAMRVPAGLRGKNLMLLTGFLLVALVIGNISPIQTALSVFFSSVAVGAWKLIQFLGSLFSGGDELQAPVETSAPTPPPEATPPPVSGSEPSIIVIVFVVSIVIMFLIGIILVMHTREDKDGSFWSSLKRLFKKRETGRLDLDYEEDIERLMSFGELLKRRRRDMKNFFDRLFRRPEGFGDMPDNRMKVRFTYKMLLKKDGVSKRGSPSTPLERSAELQTDSLTRLARDYSAAKYNDIEAVPDEAAKNARAAFAEISKSKGKKADGRD